MKEDLKSSKGKQLKQGESFTVLEMSPYAKINHPDGEDWIKTEDFVRLNVSVAVAWPSVSCQWNPNNLILY